MAKTWTTCTAEPSHGQGCNSGIWASQCAQCHAPMKYEEACRHGFAIGQCPNVGCEVPAQVRVEEPKV